MMTPRKMQQRLVNDTYRTIADDKARQEVQYRWVLKFLVLFIGIVTLVNLIERDFMMSAITLVMAVGYFVDYWIIYIGKSKGVLLVSVLMSIKAVVLSGFSIIYGTSDGVSIIWVLIMPAATMILMGRKLGTILNTMVFVEMILLFWSPPGMSLLQHPYTNAFKSRVPIIFLLLMLLGAFSETLRIITVQQLRESRIRMEEVFRQHYSAIQDRIKEAKKVRHDLRHHFVTINQYLEDGKVEEAKAYINQYYQALPFEESLTYCEHYGTNALLTYCCQRARDQHVEKDVKINFPKELPIPDEDLTVVFGNLLENALEASMEGRRQNPDFIPRIVVRGNYDGKVLTFSVRNRTACKAIRDKNNHFISTKHEGSGIGLISVKGVVEKHNGVLQIKQENGEFIVNVLMY